MLDYRLAFPSLILLALSAPVSVFSAPIIESLDATTLIAAKTLSSSEIAAYHPYANLAGAGYCPLTSWSCGAFCESIPNFELSATGGDGGLDPYWYVGYAPTLGEVIVGHQGTNSSNALSVLNNVNFIRKSLPQGDFPGVDPDATVHAGFLATAESSASAVLAAVEARLLSSGSERVVVVGHSLGAATATIQSIYLKLHLQPEISLKVIGFAAPRIGNAAFATLTDSVLSGLQHINNKKDPVPILPGRFLGYAHPNGEIHISSEGTWYSCPGHDTTVADCIISSVPNILVSDSNDHYGPYGGVYLASTYCQ